jgi:hypothetical protein
MKRITIALVAALALVSIALLQTRAAAAPADNAANVAAVQAQVQAVAADFEALKTAVQNRDKAAAVAAFDKLKADWTALPPVVKQRVLANHPAIAKLVEDAKALRADVAALETAHLNQNKAGVEASLAKIKADLDAFPPLLRALILEQHPALAKVVK